MAARRNLNVNRAVPPPPAIAPAASSVAPGITAFQYTGPTALTAIGPLSGRRYQFTRPGAVLAVDPRDRASLAAIPNLRQV